MTSALLLVCDDAGHPSVDRGVLNLVERTGMPVCAEYLIAQPGAAGLARHMAKHPLVSIGLHCELSGIPDADRVAMAREAAARGSTLGEDPGIRERASNDARCQLELFRDALGADPAHISTHGDFNLDASGRVMPWWRGLMAELFGERVPPMQHDAPHVRHNKYSWNLPATKRDPCGREEFAGILRAHRGAGVVEFVLHPALPEENDPPLDMLFDARMRVADLDAAVALLTSDVVSSCGFEVASVRSLS